MPSFSGPNDLWFTWNAFLFNTWHAFRCYHFHFLWHDSIYPILYILYEYLYAMLLFQDRTICYDGTSLCTCFFPGINILHEWNDYHEWNDIPTIWYDYLFFYAHDSFPGTNMLHEWFEFTIWWYEHISPLCTCFFFRNKHAKWMVLWTPFSSFCMYVSFAKKDIDFNHEKKTRSKKKVSAGDWTPVVWMEVQHSNDWATNTLVKGANKNMEEGRVKKPCKNATLFLTSNQAKKQKFKYLSLWASYSKSKPLFGILV